VAEKRRVQLPVADKNLTYRMSGQEVFRPPIHWNRRLHIRFVIFTVRAERERQAACGFECRGSCHLDDEVLSKCYKSEIKDTFLILSFGGKTNHSKSVRHFLGLCVAML